MQKIKHNEGKKILQNLLIFNRKGSLTAESVQSSALPLERVHHVHGRHRLPPRVLCVRHGIADHVLEKDLEHPSRLLVNEAADPLRSASPRQPADRRLRDPLNVVAENFPMALRPALAQPLASLPSARHC